MPSIARIRFTNVVYEDGHKRYNDEVFLFDGHNGAILLENGGGKTVMIHTMLQAVLPHTDLAERKIKTTLKLEDAPAHIAIEWILNEKPRRYAVTAVSLFLTKNGLDSYRYVYDYGENDPHRVEMIPFVKEFNGKQRPADRGEIQEYYSQMAQSHINAKTFPTVKEFKAYIEEQYHIIPKEWESIVKINGSEGGVEQFFDECKNTGQLFDRLLIPTVEEAMAGYAPDQFAETFEKHRESFKQYKHLKEKIEENEKIKREVEVYVNTFEGLHARQRTYLEAKQTAKAYMSLIRTEKQEKSRELEKWQQEKAGWEERERSHQQKQSAYQIAVEAEKRDHANTILQEKSDEFEKATGQLQETSATYYALKLAGLKKELAEHQQLKQQYEEELTRLDEQEEIDDIKERFETSAGEVKGWFIARREQLEKELQGLTIQMNSLEAQVKEAEQRLQELDQTQRTLEKEQARIKDRFNRNLTEMEKIRGAILANSAQDQVEEELDGWMKRINTLDQENVRFAEELKQLTKEKADQRKQEEELRTELSTKSTKHSQLDTTLAAMNERHDQMKMVLASLKPQWARLDSIYLKQESIREQLEEVCVRLEEEKRELLIKERLAFRFVDDYGNQDLFYADPFLAGQIAKWKNQFSYLETGVAYIEHLGASREELLAQNPFWPVTLITTEKERAQLQEKVHHAADRIQFPVCILTTDQVQQDMSDNRLWIHPTYWETNMDRDQFSDWKERTKQSATAAEIDRKQKEFELKNWEQVLADYRKFLQENPYDLVQELKEEQSTLSNDIHRLQRALFELKERERDIELLQDHTQKRIRENDQEIHVLNGKVEKGNEYLQLKKQNKELEYEKSYMESELQELDRKLRRVRRMLTQLNEEKRDVEGEKTNRSADLRHLESKREFQKVKQAEAIFTDLDLAPLLAKFEAAEAELHQLSKSRGELLAKIENATENAARIETEIATVRKEHDPLDETMVFPVGGREKMEQLLAKHKELQQTTKDLEAETGRLRDEFSRLDAQVQLLQKQFSDTFPDVEPITFAETLAIVEEELAQEGKALHEQRLHLVQMEKRVRKELDEIGEVEQLLDRQDPKHEFMAPGVTPATLPLDAVSVFPYNRRKIVAEWIEALETTHEAMTTEQAKVDRAKASFKTFCRNDITDVKMRDMAIQGIEHKQTYDEIIQYRELMESRIQNVIKYAEQSIITHDQQLEQFVVHVHTHLKKIADELKLIPKKTRVKVDDSWKEIYSFTIPEWHETEGKAEIRNHINWILNQLDKETYQDADGKEDTTKVRKDVEKWLQSKQLLRVVLKNQTMKVNLRKVTNDSRITTRNYTWEQSNMWSGGEKWSKNMTLFLGILNYIAEKRQPIQPKMKRHRTVIVDNPFGKASSDHVLNPVFFIAEQLGFQMIALTAHAEGKFLRDYFPIIYSCRLRESASGDKLIMTKDKMIQQAFFQDHDPQSMERLGEVEQLELF